MSIRFIGYDPIIHNGEEIQVMRHLSNEKDERIEFVYRKKTVFMFFNREKYFYYNMAQWICNIVDKLDFEGYEMFKENFEKKEHIEDNYVVIKDNVYKPFITKLPFGEMYYYSMHIKMEDEKLINGSPYSNQDGMKIEHRDEYNYFKTLDNLRVRAIEHFKENNILPKEKYFVKDKTEKYKDILRWFKENNI